MSRKPMDFEEAFRVADAAVLDYTGKYLSDIQKLVLRGAWQNLPYDAIAEGHGYAASYLKQDVGPKLWRVLSDALGEKVGKKNFRAALERRSGIELDTPLSSTLDLTSASIPDLTPDSIPDSTSNSTRGSLPSSSPSGESPAKEQPNGGETSGPDAIQRPPEQIRQDCLDWVDVPVFYGRTAELAQLEQWVVGDRCRLVALLGMGGIGKTALAVKLAEQIQGQFKYLFWRSLQNAPRPPEVLTDLIRFLSDGQDSPNAHLQDPSRQITHLMTLLQQHRCLLILDNVESILQPHNQAGHYRPGYEAYGELFHRLGATPLLRSCLVLTSREKPGGLVALEGNRHPVRSLTLVGLQTTAGRRVFESRGWFSGTDAEWRELIRCYAGNPLALSIVSSTIQDLFDGLITDFLGQGTVIFGSIRELLNEQFERLSELEQQVMYWLAIAREPISMAELQADLLSADFKPRLTDALESLRRRSLIKKQASLFTQQPVVVEYMIERLIEQISAELATAELGLFVSHALIKAEAKDYIRASQIRLILQPIAERLAARHPSKQEVEGKLLQILARIRTQFGGAPGYGAGNLINLCHLLKLNLASYDFSGLSVWQAYLQDTNLQNVNFAEANLAGSVFAKTLGSSVVVAFSPNGQVLATADVEGQILLWRVADGQQLLACQGQTERIRAIAFSPDSRILATGSDDQTVRLWDVATGDCLNTLYGHGDRVQCISFSPQGRLLASGSDDQSIRLWDVDSGQCIDRWLEHEDALRCLRFSPDSRFLLSGSDDQSVKLWDVEAGKCLQTLQGSPNWIWALVFRPDQRIWASSSDEHAVKLWDVHTGDCFRTLQGPTDSVWALAFSPDGQLLASASSSEAAIRLWQVSTGLCLKTLPSADRQIRSLTFSPDGQLLASGSMARLVQLWDVQAGQCLRTWRGHRHLVHAFALSADGDYLASGSDDQTVRLWEVATGRCVETLLGHHHWVGTLAFSPNGRYLASGCYDGGVKLWDLSSGDCLNTLSEHSDRIRAIAFSLDGFLLATASDDRTIKLWDLQTGVCLETLQGQGDRVLAIAFSPNAERLASSSNDSTIWIWDLSTASCERILTGHSDRVGAIAFSPDGQTLLSGSTDTVKVWALESGHCQKTWQQASGQIHAVAFSPQGEPLASMSHLHDFTVALWNVETEACLKTWTGHTNPVWDVQLSLKGRAIASGGQDESIKIWDLDTPDCIRTLRADRPYEGMNIRGIKGVLPAQKEALKALGAFD